MFVNLGQNGFLLYTNLYLSIYLSTYLSIYLYYIFTSICRISDINMRKKQKGNTHEPIRFRCELLG